jgi:hypothetical protein
MGVEGRKEAEKAHLIVVIAVHISSEFGVVLVLDELKKRGVK